MFGKLLWKFLSKLDKLIGCKLCVIYTRNYMYKYDTKYSDGFKDKNNCPFCSNKLVIEYDYKYVSVIKNKYPYANTEDHLLIVPKRHIRSWEELNLNELLEIQQILDTFLDKGYLLLGRQFVKSGFINKATVYHLHIHLIKVVCQK